MEFDTVNARYVRMQGIQRRRKTDEDGGASNRTGYSIKEFEIYGPAWDDSRYISEYLTTLNIKSRVSKNFTLPVKDDDYGITITWESDNDAITVSQDGKATVTRSENDVKALLTATVKRGEKSDTKKFEVTVVSNTGKEYEFSPIPQSVTYNSGYVLDNLSVFESLNANDDDSINDAMKVIEEGRRKLYSSNGSKQAAQKVIYPFVDELINILEAQVYDAIDLEYPRVAYGSFNTDYAKATDGNLATSASLGQYSSNDYFGINLGNITEVHTINITMPETNGSKKGYFKKGVLEYSVDNQHWTKINEYDSAVIHAEVENINARYIRYRALDTWENEVTGENISDILLNEMSVNQGLDYHDYSSCDTSLILTKNNNVLRLASNESFTLKSQEYVGVRFDVLKNVQIIKSQDTNLTVEVSNDGVKWTKQNWNTLNNFEIRLPQSHWL